LHVKQLEQPVAATGTEGPPQRIPYYPLRLPRLPLEKPDAPFLPLGHTRATKRALGSPSGPPRHPRKPQRVSPGLPPRRCLSVARIWGWGRKAVEGIRKGFAWVLSGFHQGIATVSKKGFARVSARPWLGSRKGAARTSTRRGQRSPGFRPGFTRVPQKGLGQSVAREPPHKDVANGRQGFARISQRRPQGRRPSVGSHSHGFHTAFARVSPGLRQGFSRVSPGLSQG